MFDLSKCEDFPKVPVSKEIVGHDKCFLLQSIADSSEKIGIKTGDWLLFKQGEPRSGDIVILGKKKDTIYKLGIYSRNDKGYHVIRSVLEDGRPAIIDKYIHVYGILKENLGKYG